MPRRKSQSFAEYNTLVEQAVQGVYSGLYKSLYEAAKQLGLNKETVLRYVNSSLTCS